LKSFVKRVIPPTFYRAFLARWRRRNDRIQWGDLRRLAPISRTFGFDRGQPIDRFYIEDFLQKHSKDIQGRVLEIAESHYTSKFGGDRVTHTEVLHATLGNAQATLVGDLSTGEGVPKETFDCIILTQVIPFIYDVQSSIENCYAALKPSGVLLATFPGLSQISRYDMDRWGDYWRFTDASAERLFGNVFGRGSIMIETHGNVLVAIAFLHGLAVHELKVDELNYSDSDYQVLITVRAVRADTKR